MANEIVKNENVEIEVLDGTPSFNYNAQVGEEVVGLQIKCKRIKDGSLDFNSVKGMLYLPVYNLVNDKLVFEGNKNRWLDVHFKKVAFKNVPNECVVHSPEDLTTGTLYVKIKGLQTPSKYVVTKDEDGEDVYPEIWVKSDVVGFIPYTPNKDIFKYHAPVLEGSVVEDPETGEILDQDPETKAFTDSNN